MKKEEQEPETESDCGNHSLYKPGVSVLSGLVQCIMHCTWEGCAVLIDRSSMAVSSGVVGFPARPIKNLDGEAGHLAGHEVQIPKRYELGSCNRSSWDSWHCGMEQTNGSYNTEKHHRGAAKA